jgi:hypothetical protein
MEKYLVLCRNVAHPILEFAFFLAEDEDDNTIVFDSKKEAEDYIQKSNRDVIAYSIISIEDLDYL